MKRRKPQPIRYTYQLCSLVNVILQIVSRFKLQKPVVKGLETLIGNFEKWEREKNSEGGGRAARVMTNDRTNTDTESNVSTGTMGPYDGSVTHNSCAPCYMLCSLPCKEWINCHHSDSFATTNGIETVAGNAEIWQAKKANITFNSGTALQRVFFFVCASRIRYISTFHPLWNEFIEGKSSVVKYTIVTVTTSTTWKQRYHDDTFLNELSGPSSSNVFFFFGCSLVTDP